MGKPLCEILPFTFIRTSGFEYAMILVVSDGIFFLSVIIIDYCDVALLILQLNVTK